MLATLCSQFSPGQKYDSCNALVACRKDTQQLVYFSIKTMVSELSNMNLDLDAVTCLLCDC